MQQANFIIYIQNNRYRFVHFFKIAFLFVNALAFAYISLSTEKYSVLIWCLLSGLGIYHLLYINKKKEQIRSFQYFVFGSYWPVLGWLFLGLYWVAIPVCFVTYLSSNIKKIFRFSFSVEEIRIDSFPVRIIQWSKIQNLILKDGLLTIDLKNNHLIQSEILLIQPDTKSAADFNEFCQSQLKALC